MKNNFSEKDVLSKYQQMIDLGENWYFDVDEFSSIISFYIDEVYFDQAKEALGFAFVQHPNNSELKIKQLECYLAECELSLSKEIIYDLYDQEKNNGDFLICLSRYHSILGEHIKSINYLKKALKYSEDKAFVYSALANEYLTLDRAQEALSCFKAALQIDPDDESSFYAILHCYDATDNVHECIRFLKSYINQRPYSETAWLHLSSHYLNIDQPKKALEAADYGLIINPDSSNALFQKANVYEYMGDYNEAIEIYTSLKRLEAHGAIALFRMGECYNQLEDYKKAKTQYTKAVHLDPQLDKAWFALSISCEKMEMFLEGKYAIERALDLDDQNVNYLRQSAYLNISLNFYEEAAEDYVKITDLEPDNFFAWFARSELLITLGEWRLAIDTLQEANTFIKSNAKLHYQLSYCHFKLGNMENGTMALSKAKEIDPNIISKMAKRYPHFEDRNLFMLNEKH